eukprot:2605383-Rhodomonas_salina.3
MRLSRETRTRRRQTHTDADRRRCTPPHIRQHTDAGGRERKGGGVQGKCREEGCRGSVGHGGVTMGAEGVTRGAEEVTCGRRVTANATSTPCNPYTLSRHGTLLSTAECLAQYRARYSPYSAILLRVPRSCALLGQYQAV